LYRSYARANTLERVHTNKSDKEERKPSENNKNPVILVVPGSYRRILKDRNHCYFGMAACGDYFCSAQSDYYGSTSKLSSVPFVTDVHDS
jgi:hypothetical protein